MYRSIPTPTTSAFHLGPFTVHAYAICIILGIGIAVWWGDRRYRAMGGASGVVADVAYVAIPCGIIGGRIYHVITSPDAYFGSRGRPIDAFKIWEGGLGIWGAIALGTLAAFWKFNRLRRSNDSMNGSARSFAVFADSLAPAILVAQAVGRFGNWFNGELFGRPTSVPWGLNIPIDLRPPGYAQFATFHPTFLYESIWCLFVAWAIVITEKRLRPGQGFFFYIMGYSFGRFFIEMLRIDEAHTFLGVRVNVFMSAGLILVAAIGVWKMTRVIPPPSHYHGGRGVSEE
jgi:prolipoprotein diacylglyceryl transferase